MVRNVHFDESSEEAAPIDQENRLRMRKQISCAMLHLSPNEYLVFPRGELEETNVDITCVHKYPVTFKIQTTSPIKFRVRPRCGILLPGQMVTVNILLKSEHSISESMKDKFLVMSVPMPPGMDESPQQVVELWKCKSASHPDVEQHRLCCVYKNLADDVHAAFTSSDGGVDRQINDGEDFRFQFTKHTRNLERQMKFSQILQCATLLILSVIVYLLKVQGNRMLENSSDST